MGRFYDASLTSKNCQDTIQEDHFWVFVKDREDRIHVLCSGCRKQAQLDRRGYYRSTPYCSGCGSRMIPLMIMQEG